MHGAAIQKRLDVDWTLSLPIRKGDCHNANATMIWTDQLFALMAKVAAKRS